MTDLLERSTAVDKSPVAPPTQSSLLAEFGRRGMDAPVLLDPLVSGLIVSLETGNPISGYTLTWNWHIYSQLFVHSDIPYSTFLLARCTTASRRRS